MLGASDEKFDLAGEILDYKSEVVEADRVTGEDCFLAKFVVSNARELQAVIDRFSARSVS